MIRKHIQFIEAKPPYSKGDVAAFPVPEADHLIKRGYAVAYQTTAARDAEGLKALVQAPETKHIPEAPQTRNIPGPEKTKVDQKSPPRKCGNCGKPGHTKTNCPSKK